MTDLKWGAPPKVHRNGKRAAWDGIVAQLQQRPGEWAQVKDEYKSPACPSLKERGAKVATRSNPDGTHRIYAMWPANE